jgi:hypothetical protein
MKSILRLTHSPVCILKGPEYLTDIHESLKQEQKLLLVYVMKSYRRSGGIGPLILNISTGWR